MTTPRMIVGLVMAQHSAGDGEQAVADAAQSSAMGVATLSQLGIASSAQLVMLDRDARPMVDGGAQAEMAGLAHEDHAALAAAPGDRRDAAQATQAVIVSSLQGLPGLGEQRARTILPTPG
jgi:hypothetical protein